MFCGSASEADLLLDRIVDALRSRFPGLSFAQLDLLFADLRNEFEERLDAVVEQVREEADTNDDDDD